MAKEIKAVDILKQTTELVGGNRQIQNGDKIKNHQNIANIWTAYLTNHFGKELFIRADMVADMMELLKVARRQCGKFNPDDYVDGAGYSAISCEIRSSHE